jgi:ABC-type enterobactin transport system permease subunit
LGSSLFFSPWLFGLSAGAQTTIGLFIAVLAVAAWEEWLSLIAGLWLIGSPWVLGFEDTDTVRVYVVTGTIVAALAAFKVWLVHQGDRRITLGN